MRRLLITCGLLAIAGLASSTALAQGGFGGSSMGGGGMGSSMGGFGSSSGMGGFGSSSMGGFGSSSGMGGFGSSSGMGGFGSSSGMGGFGSSSSGMGGMGGMGGQGQQGGAFLGRNNNQQGFLGRNSQVTGQQGMNGQNFNQNANRGGNRGNVNTFSNMMNNQGMNTGSSANQAHLIRPRQKVAFDYPVPKPELLQTKLSTHVTRVSARRPELKGVSIAMNAGGEAVLTGTVKSRADSKLAENLLRLEPGIRSVKNELTFPLPDSE